MEENTTGIQRAHFFKLLQKPCQTAILANKIPKIKDCADASQRDERSLPQKLREGMETMLAGLGKRK